MVVFAFKNTFKGSTHLSMRTASLVKIMYNIKEWCCYDFLGQLSLFTDSNFLLHVVSNNFFFLPFSVKEKKLHWYLLTLNGFKYPRWRKCRKFAYLILHRHGIELSQLFDDSVDESHLLNYEEQHSNNEGHVTSDQETPQISEKPEITSTNLKPDLHSSSLSQNESPCINHRVCAGLWT